MGKPKWHNWAADSLEPMLCAVDGFETTDASLMDVHYQLSHPSSDPTDPTYNLDEIQQCKGCNMAKHVDSKGYCGRCNAPVELEGAKQVRQDINEQAGKRVLSWRKQTDTAPVEPDEHDNDGYTAEWNRKFFAEKYPDLTDLQMHILMNIHSKSNCATGIWCESELSDWVNLIDRYTKQAVDAAVAAAVKNTKKFDQHIAEHKCDKNGGFGHCDIAMELYRKLHPSEQIIVG